MYKKIGGNPPCPCGSGVKFKKCHGLNPPPSFESIRGKSGPIDPFFSQLFESVERTGQLHGQPVPSYEWQGHRWRVVGSRLHYQPLKETFHEFLIDLVKLTFGKSWHDEQVNLPLGKKAPNP